MMLEYFLYFFNYHLIYGVNLEYGNCIQLLFLINLFQFINIFIMQLKVYSIQVSGIRCTNCAGKIHKKLENLTPQVKKIAVNVIQQKVFVTITQDKNTLDQVKQALKQINFIPIGQPLLISDTDQITRSLHLLYYDISKESQTKIMQHMNSIAGVTKFDFKSSVKINQIEGKKIKDQQVETKVVITYNSQIVKGRQIIDQIQLIDPNFKIWNQRISNLQNVSKMELNFWQVIESLLLVIYFLVVNMILPQTGIWYHKIMCFPTEMSIFSCISLINIIISIYVVLKYGRQYLVNSYRNLRDFGQMNMETLVALGCLAAFALFIFFLFKYTFAIYYQNKNVNIMTAVMEMGDALCSSTLIILIVTIGKYFEKKIKSKIQKMTQSIFPESQLFKNTDVNYIELKNRNLLILKQKIYDVSCIEKGDVIKIKPGRLLLDIIIISGKIKAVESIMTGSQQIKQYAQGQRIRSGAIILEVEGLAQVEQVFEKSTLLEIGSQINMSQNIQQNNQMGIQAICKSISNYFVKIVILISLITVIVWTIIISLDLVKIQKCDICWIVERGVGVLVASCPCALGLAVPTVIAIALNLAMKSGILIRKNSIFQKIKKCKTVAFDKTGTLFTKVERIQQYFVLSTIYQQKQIWQIVALIQKNFKHPLAQILYKQSVKRSQITGTNFNFILLNKPSIQKQGIIGEMKNKITNQIISIKIGNKRLLEKYHIIVEQIKSKVSAATVIYLAVNQIPLIAITLNTHSNLRPETLQIVKQLQSMNKEVHILSGDSKQSVALLGQILNIPQNCLHPEHSALMKMEWIKNIQRDNQQGVMMIGDGLNDIPCLQQALVGVSINAKSELNLNAADVIILSENLHKIVTIFKLLKKSNQFIYINLFWSFVYNIAMLPIVSGMLYPLNFTISPIWSSISMCISSLVVVIFSQFMLCFSYDKSLIQSNEIDQNIQRFKNKQNAKLI